MTSVANKFLQHIFSCPPSVCHRHLLMGLFDQILNLEVPLETYQLFFSSNHS